MVSVIVTPPRPDHSPPAGPPGLRDRAARAPLTGSPPPQAGRGVSTGRNPARDGGGPEALVESCARGYLKTLYTSDNDMWSSSNAKDFTYFGSPLMNEGTFL